ncbi:arsenite efflux transporter metallochaperone ArsD [Nocardia sp. NBC_01377]|uniref:arsenite efflux transporter metallochaperone ArsD n=1 Tax=Nocardia sp. NBC_01377 TaxID=2903595 RepID=UPI0032561816
MPTVEIFEPALCCNTGVCGPDLDQALVEFSADMDWARRQGAAVIRYNLAGDPMAFATSDTARKFLEVAGSEGLPLVVVDGVTALTGRYPTRAQIAGWAGLAAVESASEAVVAPAGIALLGLSETEGCQPDSGCC